MKIVFMGTPDFAVNVLQGLIDNYEVSLVVSQPDKMVGRHRELVNTPVKELAIKYNIDVFQPEKIKDNYKTILDYKPDLIITCAYGQIIPKELLDYPKYGCINVHASLLPKLRGGAPIHKALIDGYEKTGITIMYMDEKMDSGDIIKQEEVIIEDSDNLESLYNKLSLLGSKLLIDTLPSIIAGTNDRIKQDEKEVTYAFNIKREEERINFNLESRAIFNLVRGLSPIPAANALFDDKEMKIYNCTILDKKYSGQCGEIVDVIKTGIVVKTLDGAIVLGDIKPFGKKRMDSYSFVNGIGKDKIIGKVFE
ncbi:MAG: methionyl-tRNA formyltransferase [Bacilli bacterium]|nr:methionyl-tRNA formyltransferase [Bacilli bacterium]